MEDLIKGVKQLIENNTEDQDEIDSFFSHCGYLCESGCITELIYTKDVNTFYNKHEQAIEDVNTFYNKHEQAIEDYIKPFSYMYPSITDKVYFVVEGLILKLKDEFIKDKYNGSI